MAQSKTSTLLDIPTSEIIPNKDNPRLIFDEEDLQYLKDSIKDVGILVPLTVYQRSSDGRYVLLDGERRWRCAKELGLPNVPANQIEEPNRIENILRMFNIHNTRKEWELVPTALKLQTLIRLLGDKPTQELARLTGLSSARVLDCKKILTFSKHFLDLAIVADEDSGQRITGDFFALLYGFLTEFEKTPLAKEYTRDEVINLMIEKYRKGNVGILDFRILKKALKDAEKFDVPENRIVATTSKYLESNDMQAGDYYDAVTGTVYGLSKVMRSVEKLTASLRRISPSDARKSKVLIRSLEQLRRTIEEIIR